MGSTAHICTDQRGNKSWCQLIILAGDFICEMTSDFIIRGYASYHISQGYLFSSLLQSKQKNTEEVGSTAHICTDQRGNKSWCQLIILAGDFTCEMTSDFIIRGYASYRWIPSKLGILRMCVAPTRPYDKRELTEHRKNIFDPFQSPFNLCKDTTLMLLFVTAMQRLISVRCKQCWFSINGELRNVFFSFTIFSETNILHLAL